MRESDPRYPTSVLFEAAAGTYARYLGVAATGEHFELRHDYATTRRDTYDLYLAPEPNKPMIAVAASAVPVTKGRPGFSVPTLNALIKTHHAFVRQLAAGGDAATRDLTKNPTTFLGEGYEGVEAIYATAVSRLLPNFYGVVFVNYTRVYTRRTRPCRASTDQALFQRLPDGYWRAAAYKRAHWLDGNTEVDLPDEATRVYRTDEVNEAARRLVAHVATWRFA